ncbi:MAG TPA: (2Fe-2S)-binding protein [Bacteroidota bacterium]|nr:(2Fe-2S)-binding protein [Bacteroidota bacterium]
MEETLRFTLNGRPTSVTVDSDRLLLWVLRTDLGLTGTKYGCGESFCGACTVIVNGEALRSCQTPVKEVRDKEVVTIEGLAGDGGLHPVQKAFMEQDALQCGYCTPGMIMTAKAFLNENPTPTTEQVKEALSGNFCRCISHYQVIRAVMAVVEKGN